ncbi:MAG: 50S ribosomal protein L29 [Candidatus Kariarchaeaceae archaeon]|jgi:large subunit ribosomal protein L29
MVKKMRELRSYDSGQLADELAKYRRQLMDVRSQLSSGGSIDDPGKIKGIKRTIARILTLQREAELKAN